MPCCWLGNSLNRRSEPWLKDTLRYADNIMNWYDPKVMNAIDNDLTDILLKSIWMKQLQKSGYFSSCKTCARFCSKRINIKKQLIENISLMIKNTSDFNKQRIEELKKKFTLKDAMKFRSNIRFYKQDDIPSRKVIEEIIQDAHDLVPHKNNMIECNIKIYGPNLQKKKKI